MKQHPLKMVGDLALALTLVGTSGLVVDSLGLSTIAQLYACRTGGGSGGGC